MNTTSPQPTTRRVLSLLWFPFFFAAAFAVMSLFAYAHPSPNAMAIGIVGPGEQATSALQHIEADGFDIRSVSSTQVGKELVADGTLAAVFDRQDVFVASAASSTRADYIRAIAPLVAGSGAVVTDVTPLASGDVSGVGLFFYAVPNLLVGLITSIVLLQFGMWPMRKKLLTIAATGAFSSVFTFVLATTRDVLPTDYWLLLYAFILTQAIGWLTTSAAIYAKQYFMPVAMTFVLILGIPSSGGTVDADMLPSFIRVMNDWLPFAKFIDITRSSAYLGNTGLISPLIILSLWAVLGAALLALHLLRAAASNHATPTIESETEHGTSAVAAAELHGRVRRTSLRPVAGAAIIVLDEQGSEIGRTQSGVDGLFSIGGLEPGIHHVVVTAHNVEPTVATVRLHGGQAWVSRDFVVLDWADPAGNLTAEPVGEFDTPER